MLFQIVVWKVGGEIKQYLITLNPMVATLISVMITVSITNYVGVPLMHSQFGDWLNAPRDARDTKYFILSVLDVGFPKPIQYLILIVYFGLHILFGIWGNRTFF